MTNIWAIRENVVCFKVLIISHFICNEVQQKWLKLLLVVMDAGMNVLIPKEANCAKIKCKSV